MPCTLSPLCLLSHYFFPGVDIRAAQSSDRPPAPFLGTVLQGEKMTPENKLIFCEHRVRVKVALLYGPALGRWKSFCPCAGEKGAILFGQGNCPDLSVLCLILLGKSVAVVHVPGEGGKRRENVQEVLKIKK